MSVGWNTVVSREDFFDIINRATVAQLLPLVESLYWLQHGVKVLLLADKSYNETWNVYLTWRINRVSFDYKVNLDTIKIVMKYYRRNVWLESFDHELITYYR